MFLFVIFQRIFPCQWFWFTQNKRSYSSQKFKFYEMLAKFFRSLFSRSSSGRRLFFQKQPKFPNVETKPGPNGIVHGPPPPPHRLLDLHKFLSPSDIQQICNQFHCKFCRKCTELHSCRNNSNLIYSL